MQLSRAALNDCCCHALFSGRRSYTGLRNESSIDLRYAQCSLNHEPTFCWLFECLFVVLRRARAAAGEAHSKHTNKHYLQHDLLTSHAHIILSIIFD